MASHSENAPLDEQVLADHQELRDFYAQYKQSGDIRFFNQFVWELSRHSIGEEIIMYPILEKFDISTTQDKKEHEEVAGMGIKLEGMEPGSAEFNAMFDKLFEHLSVHMKHEEEHDIPNFKSRVSLQDRISEGNKFMNRKKIMPTHPHTMPANPTLKEALGFLLAPIDKFRDMFAKFPSEEQLACAHGASCALPDCQQSSGAKKQKMDDHISDYQATGASSMNTQKIPISTMDLSCGHGKDCTQASCQPSKADLWPAGGMSQRNGSPQANTGGVHSQWTGVAPLGMAGNDQKSPLASPHA